MATSEQTTQGHHGASISLWEVLCYYEARITEKGRKLHQRLIPFNFGITRVLFTLIHQKVVLVQETGLLEWSGRVWF